MQDGFFYAVLKAKNWLAAIEFANRLNELVDDIRQRSEYRTPSFKIQVDNDIFTGRTSVETDAPQKLIDKTFRLIDNSNKSYY